MAYIGQGIKQGTFKVLDTSGNTYNGSNTTFSLGTQVGSAAQLLVSHDGVIQLPGTDYTLATGGTQITFSTAPASGASIFIVEISGAVGGTVTPSDASVTSAKLSGNLETPGTLDVNGQELILDADGDTTITADTDDQIDVKISGADDFQFTANTFTAQSGSSIVVPDGGLTLGSTAVSSTAAELNLLDGGTSVGSSITVADADGFIVNDGGTMKTIPATDISTYVGGGLWEKLGDTLYTSNTSSITFDNVFSSTHKVYKVYMKTATSNTNENVKIRLRSGSSGSNADINDSNYNYKRDFWGIDLDDGGNSNNQSNGRLVSHFALAANNHTGANHKPMQIDMTIQSPGDHHVDNSGRVNFTYIADFYNSSNLSYTEVGSCFYNGNTDATGITFEMSAGSYGYGNILLYGLKP